MRKLTILTAGLVFIVCTLTVRAQQTWTGEIGDSHCNLEHEPIAEDDPVLPSPECVKLCLKSAYKYVFLFEDKVYAISNQDNPDLVKFAGHEVIITGETKGQSITISKIEAKTR
jgi:hypothetical protein